MSTSQRSLAEQKLDFAEEYISDGNKLQQYMKPGRLIIVDLRDEFIEKDEALGLFVVMLNIFSSVQPNSEPDLLFGVCIGGYLVDTTFENVVPPSIEEQGYLIVFSTRDVAKEEFLVFPSAIFTHSFIHNFYGIDIVAIVGIAHKFEHGAHLQFVPYFIDIVILTTGQMTLFEKQLFCFHTNKKL
jgi:hypothetical protein